MIVETNNPDINHVLDTVLHQLVWTEAGIDAFKSPAVYSYDNLLKADTCDFQFNLAMIGLTEHRWARFMTQYTSKAATRKWLDSIALQKNVIVNLLRSTGDTKVRPNLYQPEQEGHRWGVCFLGIAYAKEPEPRLTLFSRTARIPTTAVMELTLVSLLAKEIEARYKLKKRIKFTWFSSCLHVTAFDIMPYMVYRRELETFVAGPTQLALFMNRQYKRTKVLKATKEDIPYGRARRVTKRVQEIEAGKLLPDVYTQDLSLEGGHTE